MDQIKFVLQARGSLEELLDDMNICAHERCVTEPQLAEFKRQGWKVFQLVNGYMRYLRERKRSDSLVLREGRLPAEDNLDDLEVESDSTVQEFNDSTKQDHV